MKTSHASLLAVISLSLALCACDNGTPKEAAPPVPKPSKPEGGATAPKVNPEPPAPTEGAAKEMNTTANTEMPSGTGNVSGGDDQLKFLNLAVGRYSQKQMQKVMMNKGGRPESGGGGAGGSTILTSLDQLVTAGILKKLPDAPEGKKFVLDTKTQKVRLENK